MDCRCNELTETYHEVRSHAFEEDLSCPDNGARFRLDFPEQTQREPGQARLQRI
jgi:hypothetical protein